MTTLGAETAGIATIEYAVLVDWGHRMEFVPATGPDHAERMARTLYAHRACWTVGREVQPWRYVRRDDSYLTDQVAQSS